MCNGHCDGKGCRKSVHSYPAASPPIQLARCGTAQSCTLLHGSSAKQAIGSREGQGQGRQGLGMRDG